MARRGPTATWHHHWDVVGSMSRREAALQFIRLGDQRRLLVRLGLPLSADAGEYMAVLRKRLDMPQ